jgi:hypothetical protein
MVDMEATQMKVRANSQYIYYPNMLDRIDGRTALVAGDIVTVVNLPGCPKANTMGHAHVELNGRFAGLVHTNSLHSLSDRQLVIDAIKRDMAKLADGTIFGHPVRLPRLPNGEVIPTKAVR